MTRRELTHMYNKKMFKAMLNGNKTKEDYWWNKKWRSIVKQRPNWSKVGITADHNLPF